MQPWILALAMRVVGYVLLAVGVIATPFDGVLIILGGACVLEGLLAEKDDTT